MKFIIEFCQTAVFISEEHNKENRISFGPGVVTQNQIKAIAYKLLAMVGE